MSDTYDVDVDVTTEIEAETKKEAERTARRIVYDGLGHRMEEATITRAEGEKRE